MENGLCIFLFICVCLSGKGGGVIVCLCWPNTIVWYVWFFKITQHEIVNILKCYDTSWVIKPYHNTQYQNDSWRSDTSQSPRANKSSHTYSESAIAYTWNNKGKKPSYIGLKTNEIQLSMLSLKSCNTMKLRVLYEQQDERDASLCLHWSRKSE